MRGCGDRTRAAVVAAALLLPQAAQAQLDHRHAAWTQLLERHVVLLQEGKASRVDYAGFARDRAALAAYLGGLSRISEPEFRGWTQREQMAFLINAYNAFTIQKVLTRYPDLRSIRDFGKVFGNPFRDRFFTLLGRATSLDGIEHEMLRKPGVYDEPRVHFALNCAAIGCPMLAEEAYGADRLDAQLERQARRFLSDRTRNRYNPGTGTLEVSKIFDWYREDWSSGRKGIGAGASPIVSLEQYFSRYAVLFADDPREQAFVARQKSDIRFLDYDWSLNDLAVNPPR